MKPMLINDDCLNAIREMEENSVDSIITDPPYGLSTAKNSGSKGTGGFMGKKRDYDVPSVEIRKECLRVLKPGGTALIFAGSRTQHRMACNVEDAGFILKDTIMWMYGSGFPKASDCAKQLEKKGLYEKAKQRDGRKSHGLKPSYEPIIVCQKPNEGTYANNAIKRGVSGLWIEGGRIKAGKEITDRTSKGGNKNKSNAMNELKEVVYSGSKSGRFPANTILTHNAECGEECRPDCPVAVLDRQSGESKSVKAKRGKSGIWNEGKGEDTIGRGHNDKGGASRFFKQTERSDIDRVVYVAKASKKERNMGCEGLEEKQKIFNGQSGKTSIDIKGVEQKFTTQPAKNHHPTVKPIKVMEYLCTLTKTPTGGIVLDPFMGSGTTGIACKNTGREFVGIELDKEYFEIAKKRLAI